MLQRSVSRSRSGDLDLLLLDRSSVMNVLLRNEGPSQAGTMTFTNVTVADLLYLEGSVFGAWGDYNGDGFLDLFGKRMEISNV